MELGDLIAGLLDDGLHDSLSEIDDWNRTLRAQSRKRNMKKIVVQPGQQVKIHLGAALTFGGGCGWAWCGNGTMYKFGRRTHFVELTGPLTAYELLKALGEAQLFECIRNQVLKVWLERHQPDAEERLKVGPVHSFPLMPEWAKLYEGKESTENDRSVIPRTLEPPAEFDPIANKSLDELANLLGGREEARYCILDDCCGSTLFEGLTPGPPEGHADGDATTAEGSGVNEWTMQWSEPAG